MRRYYKIGDFGFAIEAEHELHIPAHFSLFETDDANAEILYEIKMTDRLPEISGSIVHQTGDVVIAEENGLESRRLSLPGSGSPYAVYRELDNNKILIYLNASHADEILKYDTTFTSMFALEKRMWEKDSLILHSCSVSYGADEVILFSAPSGTGKSTQGEQWQKYRGSRVINGDKNLLTRKTGFWYSQGWPICGSSEICHNEEHRIRAIIILEQAAEDRISKIEGMNAYSRVYPEITCNRWNRSRLIRTMDLIESLIHEVPVYLLQCTISEHAVDILNEELMTQEQAKNG